MIDPRLPTFPPCLECGLLAVLGKGVEARLIDLIDFPIGKGRRDARRLPIRIEFQECMPGG